MRIGLFTDTYHPAINGIVNVVDITREQLEAMGHEVFVFCPKVNHDTKEYDDHVIRFRSIPSGLFDDNRVSMFFPPIAMRTIRKLDLDVIHFFTPLQIGMMGVYAAERTDAILVGHHCTDFYHYVEHYPQVLPGILAMAMTLPFTVKISGIDARTLARTYRPQLGITQWNRDVVENMMSLIYSRCDAVIALSRKSQLQLDSWRGEYYYDVTLLPTGVDALPRATAAQVNEFKKRFGIAKDDKVMSYVGRLAAEKNLASLIPTLKKVLKKHPNARLMYVGDFDFREELERLADESGFGDRITYTGRIPREELSVAYQASDIFIFPSTTDTQGLAIHEAALVGLPIILVDKHLSEVVIDGQNGFIANDSPASMANKVITLLDDPEMCKKFGVASKKVASQFSEYGQTRTLEAIYRQAIADRENDSEE